MLLQRHSRSSGKTSNLVISHKSKQHQKAEECFDPQKVDDYLSDNIIIPPGVQTLASTFERVRS